MSGMKVVKKANEWKDGVFEPPVEGGLCGHDCAVGVGWLVGLTRGGRLDSWWSA